ncbi:hypothetical protein OFO87_25990, partial [Escherichia coli]|nr:hypothetical protein [Escherichia coli]
IVLTSSTNRTLGMALATLALEECQATKSSLKEHAPLAAGQAKAYRSAARNEQPERGSGISPERA